MRHFRNLRAAVTPPYRIEMLASLSPAAGAPMTQRTPGAALGLLLAAILATANLVYLNLHLSRLDSWLADYRAIVASIPARAWVLPVYTNTAERPIRSTLHSSSFSVIDRHARIPYLFSADLGDPMEYFSYRRRPYAPDENWYVEPTSEIVDWHAIAKNCDYLLVMKPFDAASIEIPTRLVAENAAAALLSVNHGGN